MELLKEIRDTELKDAMPHPDETSWKVRETARAVLFDEQGLVPILFVSNYNFHVLPGGGIDKGEDAPTALVREVREEVGSEITITKELGKVIEYRSKMKLKTVSYGYIGKILTKGTPHFTKDERRHGYKLIWLPLDDAIARVEHDATENYAGTFVQKRELLLLKKAKEILGAKISLN